MIIAQAAVALATGPRPGTPSATLIAGIPLAILTPPAYAQRQLSTQMASRAQQGDDALSAIGAATRQLAFAALIAAIPAAEAWHTTRP